MSLPEYLGFLLLFQGCGAVFFNKGENCIAAGRLFVEDSIHDEFVRKVVCRYKKKLIHFLFNVKCRKIMTVNSEGASLVGSIGCASGWWSGVCRPLLEVFSRVILSLQLIQEGGWSGGAKVLYILHHWGVQLILAYSWARPAILVVGKGRGGMFLFLLFLHLHSCSSFFPVPLFHLLYSLFLSLFSLSLGDDTKWPSRVDVSLNPNTIKWFKKGSCQFLAKEYAQYWLTA